MEIYVAKKTEDWLEQIKNLNQSWHRNLNGYAMSGDECGNVIMIEITKLEKDKFRWLSGKIVAN